MRTFVVPDIHGRRESLYRLLLAAEIINEQGVRLRERECKVVSIGDLANATLVDVNGDEQCLLHAVEDHWIDKLILGNHESGYLFDSMSFNGYYPAPHLCSLYNKLFHEGMVVPAYPVGNTLLTHAGVHRYFAFETAEEAYGKIMYVWQNWQRLVQHREDWNFKVDGQNIQLPATLVLDGVGASRGGPIPFGGILWSDWNEPKNLNFPQIVGHTPIKEGPVLNQWLGSGIFTLNIDCAAKKGLLPTGVWIDEQGAIVGYVKASDQPSFSRGHSPADESLVSEGENEGERLEQ